MPLEFEDCKVTVTDRGKQISQPVLQQMLEDVEALINTALAKPDVAKMKLWFGKNFHPSLAEKSKATVISQTKALADWLQSHQPIEFITKYALGTLAYADQSNDRPEFMLGYGFTQSRFSWGERVCTLIHEFTHKAIATADVELGKQVGIDGTSAIMSYGMACLTLADHANLSAKALTNAENWGYYLSAYRVEAGLAKDKNDPDWKWLEKRDWGPGRPKYLDDVAGHKDDPFFFKQTEETVAKRFPRKKGKPVVVVSPVVNYEPFEVTCWCGQTFRASFLHSQHVNSCKEYKQETQFIVPAGRSQAEHLQLAAIAARKLDKDDDD